MGDYITLLGAEDVARAGSLMRSAAEEMSRAAASMEESLQRHRQAQEEFLTRFEEILKAKP